MRRSTSVQVLGWLVGAAAMVALAGAPVRAGTIEPEISVTGGSGVPGGTVSVTVSLADDVDDAGVSAGLDLRFAADALEFFGPVEDNCAVAERLSATHGVGGMLLNTPDSDLLNLEVFVLVGPPPPPPLGNGELVTCDFRIRDGVPAGTVALEIEAPILGNAEGTPIPVRVRNGSVEILAEGPTSTPTPTGTPPPTDTPEATPTNTGGVTATATATATQTSPPATATATATNTGFPVTPPTATATNTPSTPPPTVTATATRTGATPTATRRPGGGGDGGCNVTPVDTSASPGAAALLLLPAALLWIRRRGR